jgi:hypothetical protein
MENLDEIFKKYKGLKFESVEALDKQDEKCRLAINMGERSLIVESESLEMFKDIEISNNDKLEDLSFFKSKKNSDYMVRFIFGDYKIDFMGKNLKLVGTTND